MSTNTKEKAAGAINTNGPHTNTNKTDFASLGAIQQAHEGDAIADQMTQRALAGHVARQGDPSDLILSNFGWIKRCPNFALRPACVDQLGEKHESN